MLPFLVVCITRCFFSSLLSSLSLFLVSLFRCVVVRCYRVFRCRWPSSYSLSVEHSQRQWSSQGAADLLQAFQRYTRFTEIFIQSNVSVSWSWTGTGWCERWTVKSFRISNEFDALVYIITPNRTAKGKEIRERKREIEKNKKYSFLVWFFWFFRRTKVEKFPQILWVCLCCSSVRVGGPL